MTLPRTFVENAGPYDCFSPSVNIGGNMALLTLKSFCITKIAQIALQYLAFYKAAAMFATSSSLTFTVLTYSLGVFYGSLACRIVLVLMMRVLNGGNYQRA